MVLKYYFVPNGSIFQKEFEFEPENEELFRVIVDYNMALSPNIVSRETFEKFIIDYDMLETLAEIHEPYLNEYFYERAKKQFYNN